ncbi:DNA-binding transcriptional regulator, ArsR family [Catalinimonas alkaloidigena]|uniref:DNA-binding transcriptional regulator, ArsR family n=1 Tax=Catalinimonas alkaloidigena TaxID=1075417 RepID=A0A1G9MPH0_9BACT|nr:metalloregulator ArsR/SmtB family transcription factor [Catalinimonas alkaloidigena]SDL76119.1 DNA-binding transcriptional regulator, ArsR family [Catalinimonas alkaloidigena]
MRLKHINISFGVQLFKAFSDESRVRIIHLLYQNKEMCISDLEMVLEFTQTKTSRHLIYLKSAGLASSRKVDQWVYYYLKDEVLDMVNQLLKYVEKDQVLQKDLEIYQILYSNRELAANRLHNRRWL